MAFNQYNHGFVSILNVPLPANNTNMHHPKFAWSFVFLLLLAACTPAAEETTDDAAERQQFLASSEPLPEFTTTIVEAELASPRKEMKGELNGVNIVVNYGSPSVNGRSIWNSLVPYGEVWRTGANEATKVTFDQAINIDGKELPAGTYGLFTVPSAKGWEVIFNSESDQWGAYEYNADKDVLRVQAQAFMQEDTTENLEFTLGRDALVIAWERLRVPIPIVGG